MKKFHVYLVLMKQYWYLIFFCLASSVHTYSQEVYHAAFYRTSVQLFENMDSDYSNEQFMIDAKYSGKGHFYLEQIWNEKKQRFTKNNENLWAARKDDTLFFNFAFCSKIQFIDLFVKFDILGLCSAIIIPEDAPAYITGAGSYTGLGAIGDLIVDSSKKSGTKIFDKDGKSHLIVYIDKVEKKNQKYELHGDLLTRKKFLDLIDRHQLTVPTQKLEQMHLETIIDVFHQINRSKNQSFLEYKPT